MLGVLSSPSAALAGQRWDALASTVFAHIAQDAELPNAAFPQALAQDANGYLWIGTDNGLARWDGYHFRIYKPNSDDPGSLPDSVIDTLHTDARGTLWIGTDSHGVVRYDPLHDRFIGRATDVARRTGNSVFSIEDDGRGGILAGTDGGLEEIGGEAEPHLSVRPEPTFAREWPDNDVRALLRDRSRTLWVGTTHGLFRRPDGAGHFLPVTFSTVSAAKVDVRKLLEDEDGRLWIGTQTSGPFAIEPQARTALPIRELMAGTAPLGAEYRPGRAASRDHLDRDRRCRNRRGRHPLEAASPNHPRSERPDESAGQYGSGYAARPRRADVGRDQPQRQLLRRTPDGDRDDLRAVAGIWTIE
jgi:hypothetical protein